MRHVFLSDFHIRRDSDDKAKLFYQLLESDYIKQSDHVVFLGDIFDIMVGSRLEYLNLFPNFFEKLERLIRSGKKVTFIEGNHDFHLEELFVQWMMSKELSCSQFEYCKSSVELKSGDKSVHIQHGDLIDQSSVIHNFYSKLVRSNFIKRACTIVPFFIVQIIALMLEKISSGTEYAEHDVSYFKKHLEFEKNKPFWNQKSNLVFCGHYHSFEQFYLNDHDSTISVYNTGSFPIQKKLWALEDGTVRVIDLSLPSTF